LDMARELGVKTITEEEFIKLLNVRAPTKGSR
jgi:hypothetical protein